MSTLRSLDCLSWPLMSLGLCPSCGLCLECCTPFFQHAKSHSQAPGTTQVAPPVCSAYPRRPHHHLSLGKPLSADPWNFTPCIHGLQMSLEASPPGNHDNYVMFHPFCRIISFNPQNIHLGIIHNIILNLHVAPLGKITRLGSHSYSVPEPRMTPDPVGPKSHGSSTMRHRLKSQTVTPFNPMWHFPEMISKAQRGKMINLGSTQPGGSRPDCQRGIG